MRRWDYYAAAAEAGDAWGLFCLGQLVEEGEDLQYVDFLSDWFLMQDNAAEVDQSALAVMLYRRAAESGLAVAQFCLGMCYFCGHGVPKNMTLSAYWFRCSAYTATRWAQPEIVRELEEGSCYVGVNEMAEPFELPTERSMFVRYFASDGLIPAGAPVNAVDKDGQSPLHRAVKWNNPALLRVLLEVPEIDVNLANWTGRSPLFFANVECMHVLLSVPGVDVNAKDNHGWSVLRYTIWDVQLNEDQKLHKLHMLLSIPGIVVAGEEGEGWVLIKTAIESGQVEVLRLLLSVPGIVVNPPHGGQTSVAYACVMGREDMASMLLLPSLFGI